MLFKLTDPNNVPRFMVLMSIDGGSPWVIGLNRTLAGAQDRIARATEDQAEANNGPVGMLFGKDKSRREFSILECDGWKVVSE